MASAALRALPAGLEQGLRGAPLLEFLTGDAFMSPLAPTEQAAYSSLWEDPIEVDDDPDGPPSLLNGRHRLEAMRQAGIAQTVIAWNDPPDIAVWPDL